MLACSRVSVAFMMASCALAALGCSSKKKVWQSNVRITLRAPVDYAAPASSAAIEVDLYNGDGANCAGPPDGLSATLDGRPLTMISAGGVARAATAAADKKAAGGACEPSVFRLDGARDTARVANEVTFTAPSGTASCAFQGAFSPHEARLVSPPGPRLKAGDKVTVAVFPESDVRSSPPATDAPLSLVSRRPTAPEGTACSSSISGARLGVSVSGNEYSFTMPALCPGPASIAYAGTSTTLITKSVGATCSTKHVPFAPIAIEVVP